MATDRECLGLELTDNCCKVLNLLKSDPKKCYTERDIEMNYADPLFQTMEMGTPEKKLIDEDIEKEVRPCLKRLDQLHLLEKKRRNGKTEYCIIQKNLERQ